MFIDSMCVCMAVHGSGYVSDCIAWGACICLCWSIRFGYFLVLLGRKMKFNKTKGKINVNEHTRIRTRGHAQFPHTVASIGCVYAKFDVRVETKLVKVVSEFENNRIHNGTTAPPNVSPHSKWEEEIYVLYSNCLKSCKENEAHTINNFISSSTYTLIANWRQTADHWRLQAHSRRHTHTRCAS